MARRRRIGISANFFHADAERPVFRHKTLQYLEERMALAIWRTGALPQLLPDLKTAEGIAASLDDIDALVLAGGADVSPTSYGQTPLRPQWAGDAIRDAYEIELCRGALARGLPVLGICRGIQLVNVALGGTLWQDIGTQVEGALVHRDWEHYDETGHEITLAPDSWIARCYAGVERLAVNSIHHQAIRELAPGLRATAWAPDGIVEAAEAADPAVGLFTVQWHPEWLEDEHVRTGATSGPSAGRAAGAAIFAAFVTECARRSR